MTITTMTEIANNPEYHAHALWLHACKRYARQCEQHRFIYQQPTGFSDNCVKLKRDGTGTVELWNSLGRLAAYRWTGKRLVGDIA